EPGARPSPGNGLPSVRQAGAHCPLRLRTIVRAGATADAVPYDRPATAEEDHRRAAGAAARREDAGRAGDRGAVPGHAVALSRRTGATMVARTPQKEGPEGCLRGRSLGPHQHTRVHPEPLTGNDP